MALPMQVEAPAASDQSSSSISSPPISPQNHASFSDTIHVVHPRHSANPGFGEGVATNPSGTSAHPSRVPNSTAYATNGHSSTHPNSSTLESAAEKPKRVRKKKTVGSDGASLDDGKPKEKKVRKSRETKDKNSEASAPRAKKLKVDDKTSREATVIPRQPTLTEMVNTHSGSVRQASRPIPAQHLPNGTSNASPQAKMQGPTSHPPTPTPRPISSGQNYDPVRGYDPVRAATMEVTQPRPAQSSSASAPVSRTVNRASASPSIASLIDPPSAPQSSAHPMTYQQQSTPQPTTLPSHQYSPTPTASAPAPFAAPAQPLPATQPQPTTTLDGAMDVDLTSERQQSKPELKIPSKASSSAPTPKAARPTPPPPKAAGSGLLSTSDLFGGPSASTGVERKRIDIELHINLNPQGGNVINIAQEIARKYGRDALNPRAAAHRERLLQIQAAASKIEGASADDMSVDLMSELEGDSNVEMAGAEEDGTGVDAEDKPKRKRRKKIEEYDKEDDFIDDTELAWTEQAAVAKDGFFVYSGPLVPEGHMAQIESAAPTRGGRGRGRGSRARGGAAAAAAAAAGGPMAHAASTDKNRDPNAAGRGGGRGRGRGAGVARKPRPTKADRERREAEKTERERAAAMMGPAAPPAQLQPALASRPIQMGSSV